MAERDSTPPPSVPARFSSISSSSSSDTEEDVNQGFYRVNHYHPVWSTNRFGFNPSDAAGLDLSSSCFLGGIICWLCVSTILITHFHGPQDVLIGPNSSILVESNSIFVQSIKVKELVDSKSGLQLFGFNKSPPLDVLVNWSESRVLSVSHKSYKGWPYYLNEGSSLNISYSVKPEGSLVQLVVKEGIQGVPKYLSEDTYRYNAFSWNLIKGTGMIDLKISKSSSYYVAVANSNKKDVKVELNMDLRAVLYDTKESFYKCNFSNGECAFDLGNSVVLTSPPQSQGESMEEDEWYVIFSYEHRWTAYIICTGAVICFMLVVLKSCKKLQRGSGNPRENDVENPQRRSLLGNKDSDDDSDGSFAADDADFDGFKGKESEKTRTFCAICFDSPRDCFFLPCGHCISCYECGKKVAEGDGSCLICGKLLKKVKRIFTV